MLLVVTERFDPHVDFVAAELDRRGVNWHRLNLSDFPIQCSITYDAHAEGVLRHRQRETALRDISTVWYRRTEPFLLPVDLPRADREIAHAECHDFIQGLWESLPYARWVSHPMRIRAASSKAEQLRRARSFGLLTPATCFSNDPVAIRAFWNAHPDGVVYKPHTPIIVRDEDPSDGLGSDVGVVYTKLLEAVDLERLSEIVCAPGIFQVFIPKTLDLRVTVIGDHVFACAIHSQDSSETRIDSRAYSWSGPSAARPRHQSYALPEDVSDRCRALVRSYGLAFGALDLVLTESGEYVFLELNPNGQWVWVQELTGMPMRDALVDLLTSPLRSLEVSNHEANERSDQWRSYSRATS